MCLWYGILKDMSPVKNFQISLQKISSLMTSLRLNAVIYMCDLVRRPIPVLSICIYGHKRDSRSQLFEISCDN